MQGCKVARRGRRFPVWSQGSGDKNKKNVIFKWGGNVFCSFIRTFVAVKLTKKQQIASWLLLAVFVPMLLLSSVHIHETGETIATECVDCEHHSCHGHMTVTPHWAHDCVLCQFLTLPMLAAIMMAVTIYVHVCKKCSAQSLCDCHTSCCGAIVTRGPPAVWFTLDFYKHYLYH